MSDSAQKIVVGKRQIQRELKNGNVAEIIIASNAEHIYIASLINEAKKYGVKYSIKGSMNDIGVACGVEVPTGAVGILK